MAQAAEALTMARFVRADEESSAHRLDAVVRRAEAVREHVERAEELLRRG